VATSELSTAPERLGHYRVLDVLGSGLLTTVYRAEAEGIGRVVALKVLKSTAGPDSAFHRRFEREAKLLSSLHHTNLIELHDFDVGVPGQRPPYMVLEHIDGATLAEVLQRLKRLEPEEAAALALEVARALAYAHGQGVVHRDVKPGNVLIGAAKTQGAARSSDAPSGVVVKLVDFGIAREANERSSPGDLGAQTEGGDESSDAIGTPAYMSPEQLLGESVDHRADQFALGIVLYQMLAGARPFDGDDGRPAIQRVRRDPPRPFKSVGVVVPRALERTVLRCLAKKPADRFASTNELVDELQRFLEERATAGSVVSDLSAYHRRVLARAGVLDERRAIREEPAARDGDGPRPARAAPIRMRAVPLGPTVVGVVAACVGMILGGGVIQWRGGGIRGAKASSTSSVALPAELPPGEVGWLRVNARPWADVIVDGVKMETTPLARAIRVRAGRHVVELVHPSARERRVVDVRVGETTLLDVTLSVPTPTYADEFSETAPSASVAPAPSGKETPFGVPSTLAPEEGTKGGAP
jgi:serine/threonine-protein kinase